MNRMDHVMWRVRVWRGEKREDWKIIEKPLMPSLAMGILVCLQGNAPLTQHQ